MNTTRTTRSARTRTASRARDRRGVAMVLVLIALGTATVMGSSYVASRQTAPAMGLNAETASNAKWSAQSGSNLAVAILQTSVAPSADLDGGQVVEQSDFNLGSAHAMVTKTTGEALAPTDHLMLITTVGQSSQIGSLRQRAVVRRPSNHVTQSLDPTLREFAVYAVDRLRLESGAFVAPWPDSVRGPSEFAANIGVGFGPSSRVSVAGAGSLHAARLFVSDNATSSLRELTSGASFGGGRETDVVFPRASVRVPTALTAIPAGLVPVTSATFLLPAVVHGGPVSSVTANAGGSVTFNEAVSRDYSVDNLIVQNNSSVTIRGDVRILVRGELEVRNRSAILLHDADSRVTFYVYDDLRVENSVIGLPAAHASNNTRSFTHLTGQIDASRVRVFLINPDGGGRTEQEVEIRGRSIVAGEIHAPSANVDIWGNSAVIGRVTGYDFRLRDSSVVLYDHALNPGGGLTDANSPLYEGDRAPVVRKALATFDNSQGLDSLIAHVESVFQGEGIDPDPADDSPVSPTAPDPRDPRRNTIVANIPVGAMAIERGVTGENSAFGAQSYSASVNAGPPATLDRILAAAAIALRNKNPALLRSMPAILDADLETVGDPEGLGAGAGGKSGSGGSVMTSVLGGG